MKLFPVFILIGLTACAHNGEVAKVYAPVDEALTPSSETSPHNSAGSRESNVYIDTPTVSMADSQLGDYLRSWMGTPYRFGGNSRNGIDCSGLVRNTYRDLYHLKLPRQAREQATLGKKIRKSKLRKGDLVFFKTGFRKRHVGIYLNDNKFAHSSASSGVTVSSLDDDYWHKRYWKASRLIK